MSRRWHITLLLILVALAGATSVEAQNPKYGKARFVESGNFLEASMSFTHLFDEKSYTELSSGFPTTVMVRVFIYPKGKRVPIQIRARRLRVVYDLWEELYVLRIEDERGSRTRKLESRVDVLQQIGRIERLRVSPLSAIYIGPHYFMEIVAELNPVDDDTLEEMRRWLQRSQSSQRDDSSFFGSFVSVFSNTKLRKADRVVRIRSQPFFRRKREEP